MVVCIKKAGFRHFLLILLAVCIIGFIGSLLSYNNLPYNISDIFVILGFLVIAYFTLMHYTCVFQYHINGHKITISRKTGRRIKEIKIPSKNIINITHKTNLKKSCNMCVSIFSKKKAVCIEYKEGSVIKAVWIEPDKEFIDKLKSLRMEKNNG